MNFSEMNGSVREPNLHDTFPFALATLAIELPKASNLSNSRPNRECFNLRDGAKQLKIHNIMVQKLHPFVNGKDGRSAKTAACRKTGRVGIASCRAIRKDLRALPFFSAARRAPLSGSLRKFPRGLGQFPPSFSAEPRRGPALSTMFALSPSRPPRTFLMLDCKTLALFSRAQPHRSKGCIISTENNAGACILFQRSARFRRMACK
jgi:hypothetical protein